MNLREITRIIRNAVRDNSPTILTAFGVSGTLTTAYLAAKASFRASRVIERKQNDLDQNVTSHPLDVKEKAQLVWTFYIPAAVSGAVTVGCIIGGAKLGTKKTAAAYSLLTVSEKAFSEYKDKVVEQIGVNKEKTIHDEMAQERIVKNPPPSREVILSGPGNVLCCELFTGRYFNGDMETLRKAQNTINAKLISQMEATLSDFYYAIGLPLTSNSCNMGWNSDKMMELSFSTVMSDDGRPCISFEYNYIKPF